MSDLTSSWNGNQSTSSPRQLPVLPLRDIIVFPYMVVPLFVGRKSSLAALQQTIEADQYIFLSTQNKLEKEKPGKKDIYKTGTIAKILHYLKLPDGTVKLLVEGVQRGVIIQLRQNNNFLVATVKPLIETSVTDKQSSDLQHRLLDAFQSYAKLNARIPPEVFNTLSQSENLPEIADLIAAHMMLTLPEKQKLLEMTQLNKRCDKLIQLLERETEVLHADKSVHKRVKTQMQQQQREYYLQEQMKAIQKELGKDSDGIDEIETLKNKIREAGMTEEAEEKALGEIKRLQAMPPMSSEAAVSRNYLDWLIKLPWQKVSEQQLDIEQAQNILDADHDGLEKVKERIIEYLAVIQRVGKLKGPILCLVGPPGVGKTSLGQSIARATGRKFTRFSLGGVRDEAEIRGHRRTYIGAMPGKIVQCVAKVNTKNPLFLLDEIDKMSMDFRGDPSSALLEVLDPEQNHSFNDHYLEVDYDLSDVMFVATANSLNIPAPLRDRMEVIRLSGYTEDEKVCIAKHHLLKKQLEAHGLKKSQLSLSDAVIRKIIRFYTREAGVRNLERELSKIARKVVKQMMAGHTEKAPRVNQRNLSDYLGLERYHHGVAEKYNQIGQVTGLAWTEVGGELLTIESIIVAGKGNVITTGHLGKVMEESSKAAISVVRQRAEKLDIDPNFYNNNDIHIHVPEGATPKDGPSAGIAMCTCLISALTQIPVRADVAMTGEITLRGEVLPIGGLKEKLLAAHRGSIKHVIIPHENERDLQEIPDNIKADLMIHPVRWIDEVLGIALQPIKKSKK